MTFKPRLSVLLLSTPVLAFVVIGGLMGHASARGDDQTFRHLRVFDGDADEEVHPQILGAAIPPPSTYNPMCTPAIDRLFARALERDRERRWQSAAEMWRAIHEAGGELSAPCDAVAVSEWIGTLFDEPAPRRLRTWWLAACAAAAATVAAVTVAVI